MFLTIYYQFIPLPIEVGVFLDFLDKSGPQRNRFNKKDKKYECEGEPLPSKVL